MTLPPCCSGPPSFSCRKTSQGSSAAGVIAVSGRSWRGKDRVAHPASLGAGQPPEVETRLRHGTVVRHHPAKLVPVRFRVSPGASRLVEGEVRIGDDEAELADPWHVDR